MAFFSSGFIAGSRIRNRRFVSVYAEDNIVISELSFLAPEFRVPQVGENIPESFNVVLANENSIAEGGTNKIDVSWLVRLADGTWDYADKELQNLAFESGKEYRLRFSMSGLNAIDGMIFADSAPKITLNGTLLTADVSDNLSDAYYNRDSDTSASFIVYSQSFKLGENTNTEPEAESEASGGLEPES